MSSRIWSTDCTTWSAACWMWTECTAPELQGGVDASTLVQPWLEEHQWNPYKAGDEERKRKRLIELICRVKGEEYNEKKMMRKDFKVTIDEIKMFIKSGKKIDLDLKLE